jgi:hypothetical protein
VYPDIDIVMIPSPPCPICGEQLMLRSGWRRRGCYDSTWRHWRHSKHYGNDTVAKFLLWVDQCFAVLETPLAEAREAIRTVKAAAKKAELLSPAEVRAPQSRVGLCQSIEDKRRGGEPESHLSKCSRPPVAPSAATPQGITTRSLRGQFSPQAIRIPPGNSSTDSDTVRCATN